MRCTLYFLLDFPLLLPAASPLQALCSFFFFSSLFFSSPPFLSSHGQRFQGARLCQRRIRCRPGGCASFRQVPDFSLAKHSRQEGNPAAWEEEQEGEASV